MEGVSTFCRVGLVKSANFSNGWQATADFKGRLIDTQIAPKYYRNVPGGGKAKCIKTAYC
jgi:hypothetical protein